MDFGQISKTISNPSWDLIVIFAFVAFGFFYGISSGKSKLVSLIFSLYVSGFLFEHFDYFDKLTGKETVSQTFFLRISIFLAMVIILNILFIKVLRFHSESGEKKWWQVLMLSFLASGLLFSSLFQMFPFKEIFTFSPIVQNLFASDRVFFWWLILPLVALFLTRR